MQNTYLEIKNKHTKDDKYLAVITENGLWIKDKIDNKINIINASNVNDKFLIDVVITQFDEDFNLIKTIQSPKINITSFKWQLFDVTISKNNNINKFSEQQLLSNFDLKKNKQFVFKPFFFNNSFIN